MKESELILLWIVSVGAIFFSLAQGMRVSLELRKYLYPDEEHPFQKSGGLPTCAMVAVIVGILSWSVGKLAVVFGLTNSVFLPATILAALAEIVMFAFISIRLRAGKKMLAGQR